MSTFFGLVTLLAMVAGGYFLVRLIICFIKGDDKAFYSKRLGIAFAVFLIGGVGAAATQTPEQKAAYEAQRQAQEQEKQQKLAEKEAAEAKKESIKEQPAKEKEHDIDVLTRAGHPKYYGSVKESHKVWKDLEDTEKIIFGDSKGNSVDKAIISMSAYKDEDLIRSISIDFTKFDAAPPSDLDSILRLTAEYIPFDVLDQYYQYGGSKKIVSNDTGKPRKECYVISYHLTPNGKDGYYKKEHQYTGSVDVIITYTDNTPQYINIQFGTPKWMGFLSKNGYHSEEWNCNLYDYR